MLQVLLHSLKAVDNPEAIGKRQGAPLELDMSQRQQQNAKEILRQECKLWGSACLHEGCALSSGVGSCRLVVFD